MAILRLGASAVYSGAEDYTVLIVDRITKSAPVYLGLLCDRGVFGSVLGSKYTVNARSCDIARVMSPNRGFVVTVYIFLFCLVISSKSFY